MGTFYHDHFAVISFLFFERLICKKRLIHINPQKDADQC